MLTPIFATVNLSLFEVVVTMNNQAIGKATMETKCDNGIEYGVWVARGANGKTLGEFRYKDMNKARFDAIETIKKQF